ncbi:pentapeptide repeat-containing protein [Streptomyces sp. NPDC048172]|uniref:pentapeptide repeat-containing protein n=1 Tax=Streptomyces sp. NPDC048172 TaxID=3365505 RepID=UPI003711662E
MINDVRSAWLRLRRGQGVRWGVAGVVVLGGVLVVLGPVSWVVAGDTVQGLAGKERAEAINAVRQTVLAALAGVTVVASLGYTARTYLLSRRGQVTERFRMAVESLASEKVEVRLGAVYGLEHVLVESATEHGAVTKVLAGFVRNQRGRGRGWDPSALPAGRGAFEGGPEWGVEVPVDVQAAVEVLARRPAREEARRIDLRHADLAGLSLRDFEFESPPRLEWMFLTASDLRRADLRGVSMVGSILNNADMCRAALHRARCAGTALARVDLRGAMVSHADFTGADLRGADLRESEGLTAEQLSVAHIDDETRLPGFLDGDPWVVARLAECRATTRSCPPPTPRP